MELAKCHWSILNSVARYKSAADNCRLARGGAHWILQLCSFDVVVRLAKRTYMRKEDEVERLLLCVFSLNSLAIPIATSPPHRLLNVIGTRVGTCEGDSICCPSLAALATVTLLLQYRLILKSWRVDLTFLPFAEGRFHTYCALVGR